MDELSKRVHQEIRIMQASGWQLYGRFPGGADFVQRADSGVSGTLHIILIILTVGLWLPIMLLVEGIAGVQGAKYCRVTFGGDGQPRYETIRKPGS